MPCDDALLLILSRANFLKHLDRWDPLERQTCWSLPQHHAHINVKPKTMRQHYQVPSMSKVTVLSKVCMLNSRSLTTRHHLWLPNHWCSLPSRSPDFYVHLAMVLASCRYPLRKDHQRVGIYRWFDGNRYALVQQSAVTLVKDGRLEKVHLPYQY